MTDGQSEAYLISKSWDSANNLPLGEEMIDAAKDQPLPWLDELLVSVKSAYERRYKGIAGPEQFVPAIRERYLQDPPIPTSLRDELIEWFENYGKQALAISHQPLLNKLKNLPEQGEGLKYKNKQLAIKTKQLLAKDEENQMLRNQLAEAEQERDSLKARVGDGDHVNKDEYIKFLTDSVLRMQQELEDTQDWLNKWYQSSEAYKKELSKERGAE